MTRIPEPPTRVPADPGEAAATQWVTERDAVLRGLAHALSNRVGTLSAVSGMLGPGEPVSAPVAAALQDEAGKLEALLALYRLLPLDRDTPPEPLHLPDLVPSALELHRHHVAFRDLPCTVEGDADAPPVLAPHSALLHALLVLLAAGARSGESARLRWAGDATGDQVAIAVDGASEGAAAAAWLLGDAATVGVEQGAVTVTLPTLAAARRGAGG